MTVHIKLYGDKSERFQEIKARMTEEFGYEPTNPEVVGMMMGQMPEDGDIEIES